MNHLWLRERLRKNHGHLPKDSYQQKRSIDKAEATHIRYICRQIDIYKSKLYGHLWPSIRTKRHEPLLHRQRSEKSRWLHLRCRGNPSPPLWAHRYLGVQIFPTIGTLNLEEWWCHLGYFYILSYDIMSCHIVILANHPKSVMHPRQSNVRLWLLVEKSGESPQFWETCHIAWTLPSLFQTTQNRQNL